MRKTFEDLYAEALRINEGRPSLAPYAQVGCAVATGVHELPACSPCLPRCCPAAAVPHPTPARPTLGAGRPAGRLSLASTPLAMPLTMLGCLHLPPLP